MPLRLLFPLLGTLALLAACATFPEVDAALQALPIASAAPPLLPAAELAARAAASPDAFSAGLTTQARAARLKARADALRAR